MMFGTYFNQSVLLYSAVSLVFLLGCQLGDNQIHGRISGASGAGQFQPSFLINGGSSYVSATSVTLQIEPDGAVEYSVHQDASQCESTQSWEPISASATIPLEHLNDLVSVFIKFRTADGLESTCISQSITHDSLEPLPPDTLTFNLSSSFDASTTPELNFSAAADQGNGDIHHYEARIVAADGVTEVEPWVTVETGYSFSGLTSLTPGDRYLVEVRSVDKAGNVSAGNLSDIFTDKIIESRIEGLTDVVHAITPVDLDGDGDLDIVLSAYDQYLWAENLDGLGKYSTFKPVSLLSKTYGGAVTVYDFNGDGTKDVVAPLKNQIVWFPNQVAAYGRFLMPVQIVDLPEAPFAIDMGDFNGDGQPDFIYFLAVAQELGCVLSNSDGSYSTQPIHTGFTIFPYSNPMIVDFDSDGDLDIVANLGSDTVLFRNSDGLGAFSGPEVLVSGALQLAHGDLDGDGDPDFISSLRVYKNNAGTLVPMADYETVNTYFTNYISLVADMDSDGDLDFVTKRATGNNQVQWHENTDGLGTLSAGVTLATELMGQDIDGFSVLDYDGDLDLDVIVAFDDPFDLVMIENTDGHGAFGPADSVTNQLTGVYLHDVVDFDADGDLDIIALTGTSVVWVENTDGQGKMNANHNLVSDYLPIQKNLRVVDMDGDSDLDIVTASTSQIFWYENLNPGFSGRIVITSAVNNLKDFIIADIDNDSDPDIFSVSDGDEKTAMYLNNGDGTFGSQNVITTSLIDPLSLRLEDIDGDSDLDLVVLKYHYVNFSTQHRGVHWIENTDGAGTFGTIRNIMTGQLCINNTNIPHPGLEFADLDGDGDLDMVCFGLGASTNSWVKNTDGAGTFSAPTSLGFTSGFLESLDFDNDGDLDLVAFRASGLNWYENTDGLGTFGGENLISSGLISLSYPTTADFNGNGKLDLLGVVGNLFSPYIVLR
ncbi:MAG: VCBS repeat-containing protein [Bdellovibrionales bacterium]|nr:VCBS repeat-containing protein [Bdellovibrionales bacterium]